MQHVPFRTAATQSGSFCGTVVTRELGKKNENMRVNLCGALIGIKFVMESFLCFALTPNPKEYSSHVLENHKNQVHNTLCDLSDFSHERDRQEELLHRIRLPSFFISISISHFHGQRQGHSRAMQLNMFKNECILNGVHDTQHDHVILQVSLAFLSHSSHGRIFVPVLHRAVHVVFFVCRLWGTVFVGPSCRSTLVGTTQLQTACSSELGHVLGGPAGCALSGAGR